MFLFYLPVVTLSILNVPVSLWNRAVYFSCPNYKEAQVYIDHLLQCILHCSKEGSTRAIAEEYAQNYWIEKQLVESSRFTISVKHSNQRL